MGYTVEGIEKSRLTGFRPKNVFGVLLKEFLNISDNQKILDLGCGTGFFTRIIAKQAEVDITVIDIDENLLNGARKIAKEEGLNINFELGNILNIKYPDNTFDIVMCDIMLECFDDITIPLSEMKRVCKPGGLVVAMEPFYQCGMEYYPEADEETRDLILKLSRLDRDFGVGPMLPSLFNRIDLYDIDMISWFWGRVGYKTLEHELENDLLENFKLNTEKLKQYILNSSKLTSEEKNKLVLFYENRISKFNKNPKELRRDMSVTGLPVFIVKGIK